MPSPRGRPPQTDQRLPSFSMYLLEPLVLDRALVAHALEHAAHPADERLGGHSAGASLVERRPVDEARRAPAARCDSSHARGCRRSTSTATAAGELQRAADARLQAELQRRVERSRRRTRAATAAGTRPQRRRPARTGGTRRGRRVGRRAAGSARTGRRRLLHQLARPARRASSGPVADGARGARCAG